MSRGKSFADMDPQKVSEIARMGGKAVPAAKRSFARDRTLAVEAGRKGGCAPRKPKPQ